MNKLKVAAISSTAVSWRDEVFSSPDIRSEGLEKLKEAMRLAKSCGSSEHEPQDDANVHTKATACGI
jgi:hypothetical protein